MDIWRIELTRTGFIDVIGRGKDSGGEENHKHQHKSRHPESITFKLCEKEERDTQMDF